MSNNTSKVFLGILAAVFALLALFFGVKYGQEVKTNEVVTVEKEQVDKEYNALAAEFEVINAEFEAIKAKNEELDGKLSENLGTMETSKKEVARLLRKDRLTRKELDKARALIDQLQLEKNNLMTNIQMLTQENLALKNTNDTLNQRVTVREH